MNPPAEPINDEWEALVVGALLGTDRRPPALPAGLRDQAPAADPAELTLHAAALVGAQRAAGRLPQPADRPPVPEAPPLGYRVCTPVAAGMLVQALAGSDPVWGVLVEQWAAAAQAVEEGPPSVLMVQLADHPAFAGHAETADSYLTWWRQLGLDDQLPKLTWRRQQAAAAHASRESPWDRARTVDVAQQLVRGSTEPTDSAVPRTAEDPREARTRAVRQLVLRGVPGLINPFLDPLTVLFPLAAAVVDYRDRLIEEFSRAETSN